MSASRLAWLLLAWCICMPQLALAHKPSDSYLTLTLAGKTLNGRWDIALRDLDNPLVLDANGDGRLTWGEVRVRQAEIEAYAFDRLKLATQGRPCPIARGDMLIDRHSDGAYAVLRFSAACPVAPVKLDIGYRLFADVDTLHKGLVHVVGNGAMVTAILGLDHPSETLDVRGKPAVRIFAEFVGEGIWHIWRGFDHALFLLSLLLPAAYRLRGRRWVPAESPRAVLVDILKIVTAFTAAHALTLTLATLHVVALPAQYVEVAIAVTILLAALNNIFPLIDGRRWVGAFLFGLIHGFGFANVLMDMALPTRQLALALAGFNIGVEIGQLGVVVLLLPLLFIYRRADWFRRTAVLGGSAIIAVFAVIWIAERAGGMVILGL